MMRSTAATLAAVALALAVILTPPVAGAAEMQVRVASALDAAMQSIKADPATAARKYLAVTGAKASEAETVALIVEPDNIYTMTPQATAKLADFMLRTGSLTTRPASWKDYFFAGVYALDGS